MGPDERRAVAFARWFDERTCTRIEPWRFGTVFLDREFPDVSDSNFLSIDDVPPGEAPDRVVSEVEQVRVRVGIPHRRVVVADAELAGRLAPAFGRAGWGIERYRLMVQRHEPARSRGHTIDALVIGEVALPSHLGFRDELDAETREAGEPPSTR
jgi:hypothetical protein